jgi:hypothetical protein
MNERTANISQGWRRETRRKRILIRKTRFIADYPRIALQHRECLTRSAFETASTRVVCLTTTMRRRPCKVLETGRRHAVR